MFVITVMSVVSIMAWEMSAISFVMWCPWCRDGIDDYDIHGARDGPNVVMSVMSVVVLGDRDFCDLYDIIDARDALSGEKNWNFRFSCNVKNIPKPESLKQFRIRHKVRDYCWSGSIILLHEWLMCRACIESVERLRQGPEWWGFQRRERRDPAQRDTCEAGGVPGRRGPQSWRFSRWGEMRIFHRVNCFNLSVSPLVSVNCRASRIHICYNLLADPDPSCSSTLYVLKLIKPSHT